MTDKQLESYNLKIDILYDRDVLRMPFEALKSKYKISERMISTHLKLARNDYRILLSVEKRKNYKLREELREYR